MILYRIKKSAVYFAVVIVLINISTVRISFSTINDNDINTKFQIFEPVVKKLLDKKVDSSFIYYLLSDERTVFDEKYVKINVTGFLKKPDYSHHYNDYSVSRSLDFIKEHQEVLTNCEKIYNVPKEVITSVIWIETKHGGYLGNHHIASVYLSTAMANTPKFIEMNKRELYSTFSGDTSELKSLENKIEKRAEKKSSWAINELISLEKIYKNGKLDILSLKGSWAGAFGLSQFLPSSYTKWAVDGNSDGTIDLFDVDDAIYSVANYLKINGWGNSSEQQEKAVYHYNHSKDYVNAVLTLAEKLSTENKLLTPIDKQLQN